MSWMIGFAYVGLMCWVLVCWLPRRRINEDIYVDNVSKTDAELEFFGVEELDEW